MVALVHAELGEGMSGGLSHLEGGGPDTLGGRRITRNMPHVGGVKISGGDFESPAHIIHHLL